MRPKYYPFGLSMAGISDKAVKSQYAENKYRFQKQELQNKEFSDGTGLEMYEFKYRFDDPQIGRFWSIDPLADKYVYNSTYAFSENKVTGHIELEGLESAPATGNDVNNPYIRAALKDNVTKDVQNFNKHVSGAVEVKGTVGVAVGGTFKVAGVGVSGYANGPQAEVKVNGAGKTDATVTAAGAGVKAESPIGAVKVGANIGVIEYKDGKVDAQMATGGANTAVGTVSQIKSDDGKVSENIGSNVANATISVGAKLGIVGLQVSVNVVDAIKSVGDFFKSGVDYLKNVIQEKATPYQR
jgi:RHS repeat-associated protein